MTVDERGRFVVGDRLKSDLENGRADYALRGQPLTIPAHAPWHPSAEALAFHRTRVFLG